VNPCQSSPAWAVVTSNIKTSSLSTLHKSTSISVRYHFDRSPLDVVRFVLLLMSQRYLSPAQRVVVVVCCTWSNSTRISCIKEEYSFVRRCDNDTATETQRAGPSRAGPVTWAPNDRPTDRRKTKRRWRSLHARRMSPIPSSISTHSQATFDAIELPVNRRQGDDNQT